MSWRDTIKANSVGGVSYRGSFRGAMFIQPHNEMEFGRRGEVHELPLRDIPIPEDLGRMARKHQIRVFIDDSFDGGYFAARDALIKAIETPGPGTLIHPWYGTLRVVIRRPSVEEESRRGRRATFSFTAVEVADQKQVTPTSAVVTATKVQSSADAANVAASNDFTNQWNIAGLPNVQISQLQSRMASTLTGVESLVSGITDPITSAVNSPLGIVTTILDAIQSIPGLFTSPLSAIQSYRSLWSSGNSNPALPTTTALRRQQGTSDAAFRSFVQRSAVIEAARQSSLMSFDTAEQALSMQTLLLDQLDDQMLAVDPVNGWPIDDAVYDALSSLRTAVAIDLRNRGARLPDLVSYTPGATLPALVIAHQIYGDATRADEIVQRNNIEHPGFIQGGQVLEVLNV